MSNKRKVTSIFKSEKRSRPKKVKSKISFLKLIIRYKRQAFYTIILIIAVILLIPPVTYIYFASDLKDKESIMNRNNTGLTLMDRDGKTFFTFSHPKEITYIPLYEIPGVLQEAVVSAEDKNFYTNPGFSIRGIARAFLANITAGKIVQGGSTITQELVKTALLNSSRNFLRKYQEVVLAYEINRRYTKQDIIEMYLNSVYFGEGAFGIENAAQSYFGIHAKDLDLAQCALLAGLLPAPSYLSPLSNDPQRALNKEKIVLDQMAIENFITKAQEEEALAETIIYHPVKTDVNLLAPHFALYVKDLLTQKYGEENVIRRGLKVKTTLNSKWQEYAETAVKNQMLDLQYHNASNGAAVAIDPKTGQIEVMVGSEDWSNEDFGKVNMAVSPRQPGSSFKPIIYSAAFEQHLITPATILHDDLTVFPGNYKPLDFDKSFRGTVTVRRALANSLNIPAVEVMQEVGVPAGLGMAQRLGITTLKDASNYGLSLVLGAAEVKLLELAGAYAVFADNGVYNKPAAILEVKDKNDKILESFVPAPQTVLGEDTAFLITSILSDNTARAEEFGGALTLYRPAAVKTGTTENFRDALTVGYTPSLAIGVWVGNNDNSPMDNIAGSLGAAPIWRSMMENFLAGTSIENFTPPASVTQILTCPYSGLKDKMSTSSAYPEYFLAGTNPAACTTPTPTFTPTKTPASTPKPTDTPQPQATNTPLPTAAIIPTATATPLPSAILLPTSTTFPTITPLPTL